MERKVDMIISQKKLQMHWLVLWLEFPVTVKGVVANQVNNPPKQVNNILKITFHNLPLHKHLQQMFSPNLILRNNNNIQLNPPLLPHQVNTNNLPHHSPNTAKDLLLNHSSIINLHHHHHPTNLNSYKLLNHNMDKLLPLILMLPMLRRMLPINLNSYKLLNHNM